MSARDIEGFCTDCATWTPLHDGRCGCGSGRVAVPPAGYRILGLETTAMDRIEVAKAIYHATPRSKPFERLSAFKRERLLAETDAFLASLSAAGYRVLGPDEVDQVTLEKCAVIAKEQANEEDGAEGFLASKTIEDAIRALGRKA